MNGIKRNLRSALTALLILAALGCSKRMISPQSIFEKETVTEVSSNEDTIDSASIRYLALGDSYTVGASVALSLNFPSQLSRSLEKEFDVNVELQLIATSGWRTDNLLNALKNAATSPPYELVTLLIGVNNQYQDIPFSTYELEFTELFNRALTLAGGNINHLIIISIPDWGYTPFGESFDRTQISKEIDEYNSFAKRTADKFNVTFIDITDITRRGLEETELVASDNLHPSALAYKLFVDRMTPIIFSQLKN